MNAAVAMMPGGLFDQLLVAVHDAPQKRLHDFFGLIWRGRLEGRLDEDSAQRLSDAVKLRQDVFSKRRVVRDVARRTASWRVVHPREDHVTKRRIWSGGGALPHQLRWMFTPGENAVAGVIRAEAQKHGDCRLKYRLIAKAAGLRSTTVVKRFVRIARKAKLIGIEERFDERGYNLPNVITVISKEWLCWIAYDGGASQGGTMVPTRQRPTVKKGDAGENAAVAPRRTAAGGQGRGRELRGQRQGSGGGASGGRSW